MALEVLHNFSTAISRMIFSKQCVDFRVIAHGIGTLICLSATVTPTGARSAADCEHSGQVSISGERRPRLPAPHQPVAEHEGQFAPGRDPDRLIKVLPAADK